jgi:hypothetical protein
MGDISSLGYGLNGDVDRRWQGQSTIPPTRLIAYRYRTGLLHSHLIPLSVPRPVHSPRKEGPEVLRFRVQGPDRGLD